MFDSSSPRSPWQAWAEEEDRLSGHTVRANSVVGDPASPMAAAVEDDRAVPLISSQLMEPSLAMEGAGPQSMLATLLALTSNVGGSEHFKLPLLEHPDCTYVKPKKFLGM